MVSDAPVLHGERVRLRELVEDDLAAVHRWRSDPDVTRYWITRRVPDMAELRQWLIENRRDGAWTWLIEDERGVAIGYVNAFAISREHQRCEIALMIGEREVWGRKYAREALDVLLGHLLGASDAGGAGLHKVSLAVSVENPAARRVYQACGFREDGLLREDLLLDGRWTDQVLMSILASEFHDRRSD
jgi:RimJ/RimL family protein N-acetyltransferase